MSDKKNKLERYCVEKLLPIDPHARPTRGSGCGNEVGDVSNKYLFIECKQKLTKDNIILERDIWYKHLNHLPYRTGKVPIYVTENKHHERFVILNAEDFFDLMTKLYKEKDK